MASFLWLIPGFPFISAAVLALFGPRIPRRMAAWIVRRPLDCQR